MIGIVWNCRRIGHPSTIRSLRGYIKSHRPSFVFLSEIKCNKVDKVEKLVKSLHFQCFEFILARGRTGGLLLFWKNQLNIKVIVSSSFLINCLVFSHNDPIPWQLTIVYGPPIPMHIPHFWDSLDSVGIAHDGPWLVIGDFNIVINSSDKRGGNSIASSGNGGLRRVINDHGMIDLGFVGCPYTWNNKRGGLANIQERLDRGYANVAWKTRFPNAIINHLTALSSYHKPLLLQTNPHVEALPKPFKFETMWIGHTEVGLIIEEVWNRHRSL